MSLHTLLSKIWVYIASNFNRLPAEMKLAAHIAVTVTESVKLLTDSPIADVLTMLIPGNIDDNIKYWLRLKIPDILIKLKLVDKALNSNSDPNEIVSIGVKTLQNLNGDIKGAFTHNFSVLLAQEIAKLQGNVLSWSSGVFFIEWYYQHVIKPSMLPPNIK